MSRTTDDRKDFEVKLRVNSDTKKYLDSQARAYSTSVSEYVRKLISKDMSEQPNRSRRTWK